jgi:RNA-directed DNA polymerase
LDWNCILKKTRLIEFGRYAAENRKKRGEGRPETFTFLGFTHICGKTRKTGRFAILRQTIKKRLHAKVKEIKDELKIRMHHPVHEVGQWLKAVITGHYQYYGVPGNYEALGDFRHVIGQRWLHSLKRRSQKTRMTWAKMEKLMDRWLPLPRICHKYPGERLGVII